MKSFFSMFSDSAKEMLTRRGICTMGLLIGLHALVGMVTTIPIGPTIKITFAWLVLASIGMILGPTAGFTAGVITDIIGFMVANKNGGAFHPGFTLVQALGGMIYGIFLYRAVVSKEKRDIINLAVRSALCKICLMIFCNLLLNTYFCSIIYGKGFMALLPPRIIKNLVQLPVDVIMMVAFLPVVYVAYHKIVGKKTALSN